MNIYSSKRRRWRRDKSQRTQQVYWRITMGDSARQNESDSPPLFAPHDYYTDLLDGVDPEPPPSYHDYVYDLPNFEHKFEFALLIFDLILLVLTLVSNIAVIGFVCSQKKARTTHNISIVSVTVSSILTTTCVLPTHLALFLYHPFDNVSPFLCKMSKYIGFWCKTVTIYSILGMVMNRYFKAVDPRGQNFLTGRCMFYLNFVWFSGAAYNIWKIVVNRPLLLRLESGQEFQNVSTVKWCSNSGVFPKLEMGFLVSDYIIVFTVPFLISCYMFSSLLIHMCRNYKTEEKLKSQGRILMAALFALLFFVCQLPLQITDTIFQPSLDISESTIGIVRICETVSFMEGFLNAVAYVACCKEIHHSWKQIIFGPQRDVTIRTGPSARVLLRTNSYDNVVETVCLR